MATCFEDGCAGRSSSKGLCPKHFEEEYRLTKAEEKLAAGGKTCSWVDQPYEDWKRWRFSNELREIEDCMLPEVLWLAIFKLVQTGVSPEVATKFLHTEVRSTRREEKLEVIDHPWDRAALLR